MALAGAPGVHEAAVVLRDGSATEKSLMACVVWAEGASPGMAAVREYLREQLPGPMIPSAILSLDRLPLTPSGKVDRKALARREPETSGGGAAAPRTPVEELLAGIFSEALGVERVGPEDGFFDLGVHPFSPRGWSRVREVFAVELALQEVFAQPTVADLARNLESALGSGRGVQLPPLRRVPRDAPCRSPSRSSGSGSSIASNPAASPTTWRLPSASWERSTGKRSPGRSPRWCDGTNRCAPPSTSPSAIPSR